MNDNQSIPAREAVLNNDFLLHKCLSNLYDPTDKVHTERVANKWYPAANDFIDRSTTLSIVKVDYNCAQLKSMVKVTYGEYVCYLTFILNLLGKEQLDQIMSRLTKRGVIGNIRKIVVRGFLTNAKELFKPYHEIFVDEHFGTFLDNFRYLKYFELELVCCNSTFFENIKKYEFINRIKGLFLPEMCIAEQVKAFIGENVEVVHMFAKTFQCCIGSSDFVSWMYSQSMKFAIYKKQKVNHLFCVYERTPIAGIVDRVRYIRHKEMLSERQRFFEVPYYKKFDRELYLHRRVVPSLKYCQDLATLTLFRSREWGNKEIIMKRISEIRYFRKLRTLKVDGYFDESHFQDLLVVLKQCRMLRHLSLRMRTPTEENWIYFIRRLPKHLVCIKLDGVVSNEVIIALKIRLSKSLRNLEIVNRETTLSIESFKEIIFGFKKLQFLRVNGINLRQRECFSCLENTKIRRVEYMVKRGECGFNHAGITLPNSHFVENVSENERFVSICKHSNHSHNI